MKSLTLLILRVYKWLLSPLLGPACRYVPSCSEYAMEAVAHYGVVRGGLKAAWRLARCHPLARGGFDPVVSCRSPVASEYRVPSTEYRVPSVESPDLQLATGNWQLATGDWRLATPPKEPTS